MLFLSNNFDEIMAYLGDDVPRPDGPHVLLKLHVPEEMHKTADGQESGIIIPESVREETIYNKIVGLVLDIGPDCYQGERFKNWQRCAVGDWVLFRPNEGTRFNYKGVPLRFVYEERLYCRIQDPSAVNRD